MYVAKMDEITGINVWRDVPMRRLSAMESVLVKMSTEIPFHSTETYEIPFLLMLMEDLWSVLSHKA